MDSFPKQMILDAIIGLLQEVCEGPENPRETWVVSNEPNSGILGTLASVSAEQASRAPRPGAPTVAAHADHVRFALNAARRWLTEAQPPQLDWKQSWIVSTVDGQQWERVRAGLRDELHALIPIFRQFDRWDEPSLKGAMASSAHAAYHLGAIRQIVAQVRAGG